MKKLTRVLPAAAIAAVLALSASTGAVAAALITGADVKNGSLTSADLKNNGVKGKDVKDGSITKADIDATTLGDLKGAPGATGAAGAAGAPGISGLELVEKTVVVLPDFAGEVTANCPAGKKILGVSADWSTDFLPAAERILPSLTAGTARGINTNVGSETLRVTATCATVS